MNKKGDTNIWMIIAIIFIILFVIETIAFIWLMSIGTGIISKEKKCSINICEGYDSFYYDDLEGICYCYTGREVTSQEYIG